MKSKQATRSLEWSVVSWQQIVVGEKAVDYYSLPEYCCSNTEAVVSTIRCLEEYAGSCTSFHT